MDDLTPLLPILVAATKHRGPGRRELARVFLALASKLKDTPDQLRWWSDEHSGLWIQEKDAQRAVALVLDSYDTRGRTER